MRMKENVSIFFVLLLCLRLLLCCPLTSSLLFCLLFPDQRTAKAIKKSCLLCCCHLLLLVLALVSILDHSKPCLWFIHCSRWDLGAHISYHAAAAGAWTTSPKTPVFMFSPNVSHLWAFLHLGNCFSQLWMFSHLRGFHVSRLLFSFFTVIVFTFHGYCFHVLHSDKQSLVFMFHVFGFHLSQLLFSLFTVNVFTLIGEFHLTSEFHLKTWKQ